MLVAGGDYRKSGPSRGHGNQILVGADRHYQSHGPVREVAMQRLFKCLSPSRIMSPVQKQILLGEVLEPAGVVHLGKPSSDSIPVQTELAASPRC